MNASLGNLLARTKARRINAKPTRRIGPLLESMDSNSIDAEATERRIHQQIQDLAYLIYIREGRPSGRELEHWIRAERILKRRIPKDELDGRDSDGGVTGRTSQNRSRHHQYPQSRLRAHLLGISDNQSSNNWNSSASDPDEDSQDIPRPLSYHGNSRGSRLSHGQTRFAVGE